MLPRGENEEKISCPCGKSVRHIKSRQLKEPLHCLQRNERTNQRTKEDDIDGSGDNERSVVVYSGGIAATLTHSLTLTYF